MICCRFAKLVHVNFERWLVEIDSLRSRDSPKAVNIGSIINVGILCRGVVAVQLRSALSLAMEKEVSSVKVHADF